MSVKERTVPRDVGEAGRIAHALTARVSIPSWSPAAKAACCDQRPLTARDDLLAWLVSRSERGTRRDEVHALRLFEKPTVSDDALLLNQQEGEAIFLEDAPLKTIAGRDLVLFQQDHDDISFGLRGKE